LGGLESLHTLQTLHAQGSFAICPLNRIGDFHFYYKAPGSDVLQLDSTSHGQYSIGHDQGATFFKRTPNSIGRINGVSIEILEENWLGLIESGFDQNYEKIELLGLTEIDGKWAYALGFTPKSGDRQIRYYDCKSFLMVRMDLAQRIREQQEGPESAYKVETYYSDYANSGGLNLPRKIRANASNGDLVLEISEVRTNVPVDDSVFRRN
jgi:hypothetical protein